MLETYKSTKTSCDKFFDSFKLTERGDYLKVSIVDFCENPDNTRAQKVYSEFLHTFRLRGLEELIEVMKKFELASKGIIPKQRDHYIHSVNVFIFGLTNYSVNINVRKNFEKSCNYPDMYPTIEEEFLYRWGMASLFHDVGYPLEIAFKTIKEFTTMLISPNLFFDDSDIMKSREKRFSEDIVAVLQFQNLDDVLHINNINPLEKFEIEFYDKYPYLKKGMPINVFQAIAKNISDLGFADEQTIHKKLEESLKKGLTEGMLDHGIYSSIILLKWLNESFFKSNWNPAYYYIPIVNAATAIFLHNAYKYIFMVPPFNLAHLSIDKDPLAFLLILCDHIQETDRVSYGYVKKGVKFTCSSIKIDDVQLKLSLDITKSEDKKIATTTIKDMKSSINGILDIYSVFESFEIELNVI
ncbi:MAG: hypothetical protein Q4P17_10405 [Methanobacterium sp.]|nr:hypothetical protein [Methanobacterium sp.]